MYLHKPSYRFKLYCRSHVLSLCIKGISGNVSMDKNGDRNADYSLLDMDSVTGVFQVIFFIIES